MNLNDLLSLVKGGENEHVEFKRSVRRDIHKEIVALANADGGHILVGVDDNGTIVGCDVKKSMEYITSSVQSVIPSPTISTRRFEIGGKEILVIEVVKSDMLCSVGGVAHIRIGTGIRPLSIQEVLILSSEMGTVEWDGAPFLPKGRAKKEYVDWFFKKIEDARGKKIGTKDRIRYLRSIGAFKKDKLTNAGVLFFTDATETISQSKLRVVYMEEGEPVGSKEYDGAVWMMIEDVYRDVTREIGKAEIVISTRRRKIGVYPPRVLREALTNAIAHRNYTIPADIRIFLYPDRITIKSPGGLLPGVDLDDPDHVPRNPSLCNLLYDAGFIEKYGYGIKMMKEEVKKHPELTLEFNIKPHGLEVTIQKALEIILDVTDQKILRILTRPMKSGEISKAVGVTKPTSLKHLKKLEQLGLIKKTGKGPQTKYQTK